MRGLELSVLVGAATLFTGLHGPLLGLQKQEDGTQRFNSAAVVLVQEALKLALCVSMLAYTTWREGSPMMSLWSQMLPLYGQAWQYSVPAAIYAFNNNCAVWTQRYMDPASFQVGHSGTERRRRRRRGRRSTR